MSTCIFIAANSPLPEVMPSQDYPLHINLDTGIISDGGADDNYSLLPFDEVDLYCNKKYGVYLELPQFTDGRARKIMEHIRLALQQDDSVEIWNVWLLGYWEYENRPYIRKRTIRMEELAAEDIEEIIDAENWGNKDKNRPSFYCLEILR